VRQNIPLTGDDRTRANARMAAIRSDLEPQTLSLPALLCFQNRAVASPSMGGGFFNRRYGDFCTGADNRKKALWPA